jgi:pyruvate carboxylase
VRVARAAAALGIESVAVYAAADRLSHHTRVTTDARALPSGPDPVSAYLDAEAIIEIAIEAKCDCIHPGYGFLSEHAAFARRVLAAGLTFVGPSAATLSLFGDKTKARKLAQTLNIPVVPGSARTLADAEDAVPIANQLGFPVMLKAAAGGGG